jgi:hypothetical protein
METDTIQCSLNLGFCTALLLGCDSAATEAALLDGIAACEEVSDRSLLI